MAELFGARLQGAKGTQVARTTWCLQKNYILNAFAVAEVPSVGASSGARELAVREPGKFPRAQIGGSEDLAPRKQPKRVSYRATRKRKTSMTPSQVRSRRERHGAETDRQVSNNLQPRRTFLTREETHEACLTWKKACAAQRAIESVAGPDAFADLNALGQVQRSRICEAIEADRRVSGVPRNSSPL